MSTTLSLFSGIATVLLSAASMALIYFIVRESKEEEYTTSLFFLGLVAFTTLVAALFYIMQNNFGLTRFMGMDAANTVAVMLLLAIISVHGIIWQFREYALRDD